MKDMNERDLDNLAGILDHCDRIEQAIERFGDSLEDYLADADYRDVIMMNIFQIGESVNHLSDECKEAMGNIPWYSIYGIRNRIAHGYIKVEDEVVWNTAKADIPDLKKKIVEQVGDLW